MPSDLDPLHDQIKHLIGVNVALDNAKQALETEKLDVRLDMCC